MNELTDPLLGMFVKAPELRPFLQVGCMIDMITGVFYRGRFGQSVLNGGLPKVTGAGGRGNMYKSTITKHWCLCALNNYPTSMMTEHDAEASGSVARSEQLASGMSHIGGLDLEREGRLVYTDITTMYSNDWFKKLQQLGDYKIDNRKKYTVTTQFLDKDNKPLTMLTPTIALLDSITQMSIKEVNKLYDKAQIGESDLNAEAMRSNMAKNQMLNQIPTLTGSAGVYMLITAHLGDEIVLDKYAPSTKKLKFLKGNMKFKSTPEKFTFLTDFLVIATSIEVLVNATTKAPEFPRNSDDNLKGDTDLQAVTLTVLRNKQGKSGGSFDYVVSQSDGVKVGLTQLLHLKQHKVGNQTAWGCDGHDRGYYLDIYPDVKMQRTTVRGQLENDPLLQRAMELTTDIHLYFNTHARPLADKLRVDTKTLYTDIKAAGYDWNELLNTRSYHTFVEHEAEYLPALSVEDLLRMRLPKDDPDYYKPYWMK